MSIKSDKMDVCENAGAIIALANLIHKEIPEGTDGGEVIAALACLLGAGINYAPEEIRSILLESSTGVITGIVDGTYDVRFEL